jgi:hypothetical protein
LERETVRKYCPWCSLLNVIDVPAHGLRRWQSGELIQQAFPEAPVEWREQLLTGMHVHCQAEMETLVTQQEAWT